MYRVALALVTFSCLFPASTAADPIPIGTTGIASDQGTLEPGVQPGLPGRFFWGYSLPGADLFGVILTADDVGRTFRASAETDPSFASVAALLTNGVNDPIAYSLRFDDGQWADEPDFESLAFRTVPGPDFHGATITAITFRLDRFLFQDGPSFRRFTYSGLLTVEGFPAPGTPDDPGPVPEPATFILAGTGVMAILARARKRRTDGVVGA